MMLEGSQGNMVESTDIIRLPLVANLHRIELSREFKYEIYVQLENCIQTLVIGVKSSLTYEQLAKTPLPEIARTNLTEEELEGFEFKTKLAVGMESKFVFFKPN